MVDSFHPSIFFQENKVQITVHVHPKSHKTKIEIFPESIEVFVKDPPEKNKANKSVIKLISQFFSIPSSAVGIVRGATSKTKVIQISNKEASLQVLDVLRKCLKKN